MKLLDLRPIEKLAKHAKMSRHGVGAPLRRRVRFFVLDKPGLHISLRVLPLTSLHIYIRINSSLLILQGLGGSSLPEYWERLVMIVLMQ